MDFYYTENRKMDQLAQALRQYTKTAAPWKAPLFYG